MAIKIYNSLTAKKEEFVPITPGLVKMYVCGPTVYDVSHIGHLRAAYVFDVIRSYLAFRGYKVTFVRNITDVDDKIINRAREELKNVQQEISLNEKVRQVAEHFTRLYQQDMEKFGITVPDTQPKATEHIADMIAMIRKLIDKGFAYVSDGDVYFEVRRFPDYGKLSHQSIDQMMAGARVEPGIKKNDPLDFALWKKAKEGEPSWDSPWGQGRPGWHIECSVMSTNYLDETFDIHGGGRDLIFPHHENEIAQAEAATGKPFANYWIHNGLLTVNKEKMAKSLGNFITIEKILEKNHPDALKILFLSCHYSSPVDYSEERLVEAEKAREKISIFFSHAAGYAGKESAQDDKSVYARYIKNLEELENKFIEAMDDDFNTAEALARLFDMRSAGSIIMTESRISAKNIKELLALYAEKIKKLGAVLGLFQHSGSGRGAGICDKEIEEKIALRLEYKRLKNFKAADVIREELQSAGVVLEDTKDGRTLWRVSSL